MLPVVKMLESKTKPKCEYSQNSRNNEIIGWHHHPVSKNILNDHERGKFKHQCTKSGHLLLRLTFRTGYKFICLFTSLKSYKNTSANVPKHNGSVSAEVRGASIQRTSVWAAGRRLLNEDTFLPDVHNPFLSD